MPFREPLTAEDLSAISNRYSPIPGRAPSAFAETAVWPDVLSLLFEIKRLRSTLLRVDQLKSGFKAPSMALESVLQELLEGLAREPCVREMAALKDELLYPSGRKVKPQRTPAS